MKAWVGVDVSKLTLDICWFNAGNPTYLKVTNDPSGFRELLNNLPVDSHIVMEATGAYYLRFAHYLVTHSIQVSVVNPISIRRFAQMKLSRVKTDKYDSAIIASYGESQEPVHWQLPDAKILELQQLCTLEEQLIVNKGALTNQLEAFSKSPFASKAAIKMLSKKIKSDEQDLKALNALIESISKENYGRQVEILNSIPGMGMKTAVCLIVATKGFRETTDGRSLCAYAGLSPRPYQSGTSVKGKGRISKMGNRSLRNKLYMCSLTAIRFNPACKAFYTRLRKNGKPAKVALIAVASKLLRQAAAMIKSDKHFDERLAFGA